MDEYGSYSRYSSYSSNVNDTAIFKWFRAHKAPSPLFYSTSRISTKDVSYKLLNPTGFLLDQQSRNFSSSLLNSSSPADLAILQFTLELFKSSRFGTFLQLNDDCLLRSEGCYSVCCEALVRL